MELHIIEQNSVAREQSRDEKMLDICVKDLCIYRPLDAHRRTNSAQTHRTDDRDVTAAVERLTDFRPFPQRRSGVGARHRNIDAELVNENQTSNG